jgi:hypothetical protein
MVKPSGTVKAKVYTASGFWGVNARQMKNAALSQAWTIAGFAFIRPTRASVHDYLPAIYLSIYLSIYRDCN